MNTTIKDKIQTQIYLHQHLLHYDDTDSDDSLQHANIQQQSTQTDKIAQTRTQLQRKFIQQIDIHQQIKERRKRVLNQLKNSSNQNTFNKLNSNILKKSENRQKSQKRFPNQQQQASQTKTIIQLKSKLAQVFKESNQKSSQINNLEAEGNQMRNKIKKFGQLLEKKQNQFDQKNQNIFQLNLQKKKLHEQYDYRVRSLQEQYINTIELQKKQIRQKEQLLAIKERKLKDLEALLKLKNSQGSEMPQSEEKVHRCVEQNKKLKKQIKRLLSMLQLYVENKSNSKHLQSNTYPFKPRKSHSVSFPSQKLHNQSKNKTLKSLSKRKHNFSTGEKNKETKKSSIPTLGSNLLVNEIEQFLKKWHIAQNNQKFVVSLAEFIGFYVQKYVNENKQKMQNQYKSLKNQLKRKANYSLTFQQVMKEKELGLKSDKNFKNSKFHSHKTESHLNRNFTISSQDVSILIPASNKVLLEKKKNKFLDLNQQKGNNLQKDEIGYHNLQKSIRIHNQASNQSTKHTPAQINKVEKRQKQSNPRDQQSKSLRKAKTEFSIDFINDISRIDTKYSSNRGLKKSQNKYFDMPLKRYQVI